MSNAADMRREFEAWCKQKNPRYQPTDDGMTNRRDFEIWQAAAARKDAEIVELRKDALRAATVAFSLMVNTRPNGLPDDAQQLAEWLEINALYLLPVDDDVEALFIDIIREAIRQGDKVRA